MPRRRDHDEPRAGNCLGERLAVFDRVDAVGLAPHDQDRHGDLGQPPEQSRVGERRPAVHRQRGPVGREHRLLLIRQRARVDAELARVVVREVGDLVRGEREEVRGRVVVQLQAARVDEHDAADPGAGRDRHLGRDPAADRVADHGHAGEVLLVEQDQVSLRQVTHGVQRIRPRRAAEPRVHRDQDARAGRGEQIGEARHRLRPGPAVQQQERTARAAVGEGDVCHAASLGAITRFIQVFSHNDS